MICHIWCKDKSCGEHQCDPISCLDYQLNTRAPFDAVAPVDQDSSCKIWTRLTVVVRTVVVGDGVLRC